MPIDQEYENFLTWLRSQSQGLSFLAPGRSNYRNSSLYKLWVKSGKPASELVPETFANEPVGPSKAGQYDVQNIRMSDGKTYQIEGTYDVNGAFQPERNLGEVESGLTASQQEAARQFNARLAFDREQTAQVPWSTQLAQAQHQQALEVRRGQELQSVMQGAQAVSPEARAQMYEQIRRDVLSGIDQTPRNWIQYLKVKNAPNPFAQPEVDLTQREAALEEEYKRAKSAADIVRNRLKDLNNPLTPEKLANPRTPEEQLAAVALKTERDLANKKLQFSMAREVGASGRINEIPEYSQLTSDQAKDIAQHQIWATPKSTGVGGNMVITGIPENLPEKTGIPIPDWLKDYVPGLKGKQFLEEAPNAPITRPSAQSWLKLPEAKAQMLAGYADWSGQDWNEILRQMSLERPNAAATPRRSSPFMQR